MTRPGDPGHAAASREAARTHDTEQRAGLGCRTPSPPLDPAPPPPRHRGRAARRRERRHRRRERRSSSTARSVERLDASLRLGGSTRDRGDRRPAAGIPGRSADDAPATRPAACPASRSARSAGSSADGTDPAPGTSPRAARVLDLDAERRRTRSPAVPADGEPHTIDVPASSASYRAIATSSRSRGDAAVVLALPLAERERPDDAARARRSRSSRSSALMLALVVGSAVVRRALSAARPRSTATAQRVSELPLDRGDVALAERVPVDDDRTEVGRLGTAFNRMLGHVASALVGARAERAEGAPLRRRRQPRAAHAARLDPRLRRAHPTARRRAAARRDARASAASSRSRCA